MKRRVLLQAGLLGTVGFGNPVVSTLISPRPTKDVRIWFRTFCDAFSARCNNQIPPPLQTLVNQSEAYLEPQGFQRSRNGLFLTADGQHAFYPMLMRHARAGITEMAVPLFSLQTDGTWKRQAMLSGFQLEALCMATLKITSETTPLAELLLPAGPQPAEGFTWNTRKGAVTIKTILKDGLAQTDIYVYSGDQYVFSDSFCSKHTLKST
ncbi:MAG: hypothetical protein JNM22_21590 [Saprospiraceae bacterium]|nr:hypothetical protein [Saprospiraceae bacterium]